MHFITSRTQTSPHTFDKILDKAHQWFDGLTESKQKSLKEDLDHGASMLVSNSQLKAYLHYYGEIHQAKLIQAFGQIPHKVWSEDGISVVDYGCGQGIAEMVLSDYIASKWIDNDYIKDFTLIDPSRINLRQAEKYVKAFYYDAKVSLLFNSDDEIIADNIRPESQTVIHIFSNVVDLDGFNGSVIADILSMDKSHNNIVICVSPYYQDNTRGKRIEKFGKMLHGYYLAYKFEKHTDEWDKPYSCQIHIYISSYY